MASAMWGFLDAQGDPHVFYQSKANHLIEAAQQPNGSWKHYDQTVNTGSGGGDGPDLAE